MNIDGQHREGKKKERKTRRHNDNMDRKEESKETAVNDQREDKSGKGERREGKIRIYISKCMKTTLSEYRIPSRTDKQNDKSKFRKQHQQTRW